MKSISRRDMRIPRMNVLASCLALALSIGSGAAAATAAGTSLDAKLANYSHGTNAQLSPVSVSPALRDAMAERMRAIMVRTPPAVPTSSIAVTNCNDAGAGSLREAVTNAVSGDTIDLTNTGCSLITLTTGSVLSLVDDLTLQGPGTTSLFISGGNIYAPILHVGTGTLAVNDLTIENGNKYFTDSQTNGAKGGGIYSTGFVSLDHAEVKYCSVGSSNTTYGVKGGGVYGRLGVSLSSSSVVGNTAESHGSYAYGGGVYTQGSFTAYQSIVAGNTASAPVTGFAQGGGVEVGSNVSGSLHLPGGSSVLKYSSIVNNVATSPSGASIGGGMYTTGNVTIENSLIASNQANSAGGLDLRSGANVSAPLTLLSSTVSGNSAVFGAGVVANADSHVYGSTITANANTNSTKYGAGFYQSSGTATLQSSIIAGNTTDEGSGGLSDDIDGGGSLAGANNLIGFSQLTVPTDTLGVDPGLHALAYNGGPTATHSIGPSSPALNAGNNTAGVANDQRGPGFVRVSGPAADIGSYEFNFDDLIFADGFD